MHYPAGRLILCTEACKAVDYNQLPWALPKRRVRAKRDLAVYFFKIRRQKSEVRSQESVGENKTHIAREMRVVNWWISELVKNYTDHCNVPRL